MGKRLVLVLLGLALVAAACGGVKGAQRYTIQADQPSPAGKKVQFSQFFPGSLTAQAGDTLVFKNGSSEAPHTFTFGVKSDRSNSPSLFGAKGENAAVFGPCFDSSGASSKLQTCKSKTLPAYDGKGYWNSGAIFPGPTAKDTVIKLASDIPDGDYAFVCVLHHNMNGVLAIGKDRKSVKDIKEAVSDEMKKATQAALEVKPPAVQRTDDTVTITAGWGTPAISYNEFSPLEVTIKSGQTVKWAFNHPEEPHTITFDSPFKQPADPRTFGPGGVKSGSSYSGGFANSGLIDRTAPPFMLKFAKAGTYKYVCTIHPGMQGTVKVT